MSRREPPRLSIVIPAFNEADRTGPCLRAAAGSLDAREPGGELLVVDDGSALPPELESGPGRGAVLELPLHFYDGFQMYLQTRHRRPLVGGYLSYVPPAALEHLSTPLMRALQPAGVAYDSANYPPPLAAAPAVSRRAAALLPFRFNPPAAASELYRTEVAAAGQAQQAADSAQARALLERLFGAPDRTVAGQVEIWQLAP